MQHWSLLDLNRLIRDTLDSSLEPAYWVVGEIAEMRTNQRGHCYLELIEKEDEKVVARMRATIWAYSYRSIAAWFESQSGQPLKNGLKVLCQVSVSFHEIYGLSLNIREIDPRFTLGERARKRMEIINRLKEEGVFDMNRMHSLPLLPRKIAVISSSTAAGYGDFMKQLEGNAWGYRFEHRLFNAVMQGDAAPESIMQALNAIHESQKPYDLVVILRGGGAQVDLDCYDTYALANHVAQFPLPVITGIGHERDETITDMVAHTSVKTPTAAAEFLISGIQRVDMRLDETHKRLLSVTSERIRLADRFLGEQENRLRSNVRANIHHAEKRLLQLRASLGSNVKISLNTQNGRLSLLQKSLDFADPARVLKRGYTLTLVNGKAFNGENAVPGDTIETIGSTYNLYSTIKEIHRDE